MFILNESLQTAHGKRGREKRRMEMLHLQFLSEASPTATHKKQKQKQKRGNGVQASFSVLVIMC
jgi:hypothetical protein